MKRIFVLALLISNLLAPLPARAQHAAAAKANAPNGVEARVRRVEQGLVPPVLVKGVPAWNIEERMKFYKVPAVSVAVINDFRVEWAKAYGVTDAETREPATTKTLFQAASISKPVAATVALNKVEKGKLSLDEDINNKLTSWKVPENEFTAKKKVTLANLLSHTAGLTVHGFPGYEVGAKLPTVPQILDGASANTAPVRVDLEPGTRFRYSGGGTTVAQLALMDIERKPFPVIARETVLKPLGMDDSTYEQPLPPEWRRRAAAGHKPDGSVVKGKIHVYPEMAAAGLWTTPTDLAKFAIETQLSLAGRSNKVLSKEMTRRMVTPFVADSPVGLGLFVEKKGATLYYGHNGANEGFRSALLFHPDKGYGVAVMVNSDNGQIAMEVMRAVAREYAWQDFLPAEIETVSVAPDKLDAYVGRYLVNPDLIFKITREGSRLFAEQPGATRFELYPTSETTFIRNDSPARYVFAPAAEGQPASVSVSRPDGGTRSAPRVADTTLVPYELLTNGKSAEAVEAYRKIKKEQPTSAAVSEQRLNGLGYELLRAGKKAEAVAVFALNVELYPESSNVYDSLGEAYMESGDKELAVKNYRRSLELDPKNTNAVEMLKKLEQR